MVAQADHVEWVVVDTEVEALILEHSLIQAHRPRFNVRLKDDKSYPWLAVTAGRGVAPAGRGPGPQAQGGALLRPLRPRRRHPRHPRPPAAELPGPHVLGHQVHAARSAGPALPALRHRAVLGPVRRRRRPRALRRLWSTDLMGFLLGRHRAGAEPGCEAEMEEAAEDARVRAGRPPARPARRRAHGGRDPADGHRAARGPRRGRASPRTRWRRRCRSSTSAGAGSSGAAGLRGRQGGGPDSRAQFMGRVAPEELYGRRRAPRCPRRVLVPELPGRPPRSSHELAAHRARRPGGPARCPSAAGSGRCWRP